MNTNQRHIAALALVLLTAPLSVVHAQEKKAPVTTPTPAIDPEAVAAIEKMQAFVIFSAAATAITTTTAT